MLLGVGVQGGPDWLAARRGVGVSRSAFACGVSA